MSRSIVPPLVDRLAARFGAGRVFRVAPVESDVPERPGRRASLCPAQCNLACGAAAAAAPAGARRILVVSSGHSAIGTLIDLASLAEQVPGTRGARRAASKTLGTDASTAAVVPDGSH
jgi:hypothetical protein